LGNDYKAKILKNYEIKKAVNLFTAFFALNRMLKSHFCGPFKARFSLISTQNIYPQAAKQQVQFVRTTLENSTSRTKEVLPV
jgi:hypothetical protein